jgi:putative ABC transport system ATP-binding protein
MTFADAADAAAILKLTALRKSYPHPAGQVEVLRGVDATFSAGEKVAVLGPSGSGKSTLLALVAGLDRPTAGSVVLAGTALETLNERDLTRYRAVRLGIVFQQFHLMSHLTSTENVALPLAITGGSDAAAKAREALTQVGLGHRLKHYPHELSGGESQRVAIARALVTGPPVLLADEPSGNLDAKTGGLVMRQLFERVTAAAATLILVTHNEELASWCDRRLLLHDGRLLPYENRPV